MLKRRIHRGSAEATLRGYLEGIANILLANDKNKFRPLVRELYATGLSIQQRIHKQSEESVLSERELANFVPFEDLVKRRDALEVEWMKEPTNLKLNMFTFLLSVNTLCPPLRLYWLRMEVFPPRLVDGRVPKVKPAVGVPPPENGTNYLYEEKQGHWCVVLQRDKIENKRRAKGLPRQIIRLNGEIEGVTNGRHLNEIITSSLEYAPRNYPLIGIKTKELMGQSGYDSVLSSIFAPKNQRKIF